MATINGSTGNDTINGTIWADTINANSGNDVVYSGSGNDYVLLGSGNDSATGDAGIDTLSGDLGQDTLYGGLDNDVLTGGDGRDLIYGGDGADNIRGDNLWVNSSQNASTGGTATNLTITNSADGPIELWWINAFGVQEYYATIQPGATIVQPTFTASNWILRAPDGYYLQLITGAANQTVNYGAGGLGDTLYGDAGNDTLYGEYGADLIYAGNDNDSVFGGTGNDSVFGGLGADYIDLGDGNDSFGNFNDEGGNDTIYGGAGNDYIISGGEDDQIFGGTGDDSMSAGVGSDSMYGGAGDDDFYVTDDHNYDYIAGGADSDDVYFGNFISTSGVNVTFTGSDAGSYTFGGTGTNGNFIEIERIAGTEYADTLNAAADANGVGLYGFGGNDSIIGGSGADVLDGGAGNDTLNGGGGNDTLQGGDGNDLIYGGGDTGVAQRLTNGDFSSGTTGWTETGGGVFSGGGYLFDANTTSGTLTHTAPLTGLKTGPGTNGAGQISFDLAWNDSSPASTTGVTTVEVRINGVTYATITTPNGDGTKATITYLNGATGPVSSVGETSAYSGPATTITINLPASVPDTGTLTFFTNAGGSDDIFINNFSVLVTDTFAAGNDSLDGGLGDDALFGGSGADTLNGGDGADTLDGGDGNDTLIFGTGDNQVFGGDGDDYIDDVLSYFETGNNLIYGGAGNDTIWFGAGDTTVYGGDGNDYIDDHGGELSGFNLVDAGSGDDTVYAGLDDDTVYGGAGHDLIHGGDGSDQLYGEDGNDTLDGGAGDDYLAGGAGTDSLSGGDGADTLFAIGGGADTLEGGADGDTFDLRDLSGQTVLGGETTTTGADTDRLTLQFTSTPVTVTYSGNEAGTITDGVNSASFSEIEQLALGDGSDTVYGGTMSSGASINGGGGGDWLYLGASSGDNTLEGSGGNDTIDGGSGADLVYGGSGRDELFGWDGNDSLNAGGDDDFVFGEAGNDSIDGAEGNDTLFGGTGDDTILGGDGADIIFGEAGADNLVGGGDADVIYGGAGDTVQGGETGTDSDTLILNYADVESITYGGGNNEAGTVTFTAASGGGTLTFSEIENIQYTGAVDGTSGADSIGAGYVDAQGDAIDGDPDVVFAGDGDDTVTGMAGDDTVYGGDGNDTLLGEDGNDRLRGDGDNDVIYGGTGQDTLEGGTGDDALDGGSGDDRLTGGAGADSLTGGDGADTFVLVQAGDGDTVSDFDMTMAGARTTDQLDVSDLRTLGGDPITWQDVVVTDTVGDGSGDAVLTFPNGESVVLQGVSPEQVDSKQEMVAIGIPCFTAGTRLLTPTGWKLVETLRLGDCVLTPDGPQPVIWAEQRRLDADDLALRPDWKPVHFPVGAVGNTVPLRLSPQHAVLMTDTSGAKVLVRAKHLAETRFGGARVAKGVRSVSYHHILLGKHAILCAEGAATESFYPGPSAMAMLQWPARLAVAAAIVCASDRTTRRISGTITQEYGARAYPLVGKKTAAGYASAAFDSLEALSRLVPDFN